MPYRQDGAYCLFLDNSCCSFNPRQILKDGNEKYTYFFSVFVCAWVHFIQVPVLQLLLPTIPVTYNLLPVTCLLSSIITYLSVCLYHLYHLSIICKFDFLQYLKSSCIFYSYNLLDLMFSLIEWSNSPTLVSRPSILPTTWTNLWVWLCSEFYFCFFQKFFLFIKVCFHH